MTRTRKLKGSGVQEMSTEMIRIPDNMHPWHCNVNGVTYIYKAGIEVEASSLPPEVLALIRQYWKDLNDKEHGGSSGGDSGINIAPEDAVELLAAAGVAEPVTDADGKLYVDASGKIFVI